MSTAPQKEIPNKPFAYFWFVSKPHKKWMFSAIILVTTAAALDQSTSYFFKLIVDAVERGDGKSAMVWALLFPVAVFAVQSMYRCSGYLGAMWTTSATKTSVDTLHNRVLGHSHSYFTDRFAGSITNKIRNVSDAIGGIIPDFLWGQLATLVSFLVTFVFIVFIDLGAASIFIALIALLFLVNARFAGPKAALSKASAEAGTKLQGRVVDIFSNVTAVRQYVRVTHELDSLRDLTENRRLVSLKNWLYTERMLLVNSAILFLFAGLLFWLIVTKWQAGLITTGDLVLVMSLVSQITGSLLFIGRSFNSTAQTIGEVREGLEDITIPYDITDESEAAILTTSGGQIEWKNVSFQFGENKIFNDFALTIPAGQRVGLVGSSGAGKSTFVSLLLRQYEIKKGEILIDGQSISSITQDSLRQAISIVPQEPQLFHRTIRENITYGKLRATDDEVYEVARKAQAHDFICALPEGYDTLVGERGVKLSGGQKQRVAIARAMLKDAPILILDEATSALDSESEVVIQRALHILMSGKTVIAIAHRLSTLREMDRIIVLENGAVSEDGTHDSLVAYGGVYAKLWNHQSGGFL